MATWSGDLAGVRPLPCGGCQSGYSALATQREYMFQLSLCVYDSACVFILTCELASATHRNHYELCVCVYVHESVRLGLRRESM